MVARRIAAVYEDASKSIDATYKKRVIVIFVPPRSGNYAPSGITFDELESVIPIFANQDTPKEQLLAVRAQELADGLIHKKYKIEVIMYVLHI